MNKYSSKAIKTAATVGMSLAMVLSNAAPVLAGGENVGDTSSVPAEVVTDKQTAVKAQNVVFKVLDALTVNYKKVASNVEIFDSETTEIEVATGVKLTGVEEKTLADLVSNDIKLDADLPGSKFVEGATLLQIATFFVDNSSYIAEADLKEDVLDFAKFIKGYTEGTSALSAYFDASGNFNSADGAVIKEVADNGITNNRVKAEAIYKVITDNEKYLNAVAFGEGVLEDINSFKSEVQTYRDENEDTYNKEYVKALEGVVLVDSTTEADKIYVYDAVEKEVAISYKNLKEVERVLKNIKDDKVNTLSSIAKYSSVKDAKEVVNYIEGIEAIIADMKEVKDILQDTNTDVKAYKKDLSNKVTVLVTAIEDYSSTSDDEGEDADEDQINLDKALNAFRSSDATALKNFVEDYIGNFYTLTPKKLSSGKYVVRLENADYGRYVTNADVFGLIEENSSTEGLQYLLTTVINNTESEETYYDVIVNTVTTVESLLKAVTTDIEGITLGSTLTDKQAAKIVAAKKALNQLVTKEGKIAEEYSSALTSKEKKAVLANVDLIETLYLKLILNGNVSATGWVDKGNGNWDYIAEDGSRPTKWIASGSNWYYVKNGTMLRNSWIASDAQGTRWYYVDDNGVMVSNTTVNGYTFNSYGVWVK